VAPEAVKRDAGECPDFETVAAYLDGRLDEAKRTRVTAHLASCEECYFVFSEAAQTHLTRKAVERRRLRRWWPAALTRPMVEWPLAGAYARVEMPLSMWLVALAFAVAILLVVGTGELAWRWRSGEPPELRALVAAVGTDRTIEPRLTGGFAYGPLRGAMRTGEPSATSLPVDVRIAAVRIEKEATEHRTPQTLKALGIAYLVTGDASHAVLVLEEAADQTKDNAQILCDLSAAYLMRATRNNEPQDFGKALTMADRAVKVDPRLAEGWFNRASVLEHLSLWDEARQAWQDYLKVDSKSGWAEEARNRLKTIPGTPQSGLSDDERRKIEFAANGQPHSVTTFDIVKTSPQAVRDWIDEQLLVAWPQLILNEEFENARAVVSQVEPLAEALAEARADAFARDAVAAVVRASVDGQRVRTLAKAHQLYHAAAKAYDADRIGESAQLIGQAIEPLEQAGSSFAGAARRFQAIGLYYANDLSGALAEINDVAAYAQHRRYPTLLGFANRLRGLIYTVRGEFADGIDASQSALKNFQVAGDTENVAGIQATLAEEFQYVGDMQQSWLARYASLSLLGSVRQPIVQYRILQGASLAALREDLPEVALHFQAAALDSARRGNRDTLVIGYLNRAEIFSRLGQTRNAAADLLEAQRFLSTIQDPLLVSRNEARIFLARGETIVREQSSQAIEALSKALAYFVRTGASWPLASVYLALGRAHLATHQVDLAEADFLSGIRVFERMRSTLTSENFRTSFFERPWDLFSEMIRLQADNGNADRALLFAEQARARTLLEAVENQTNATPSAPLALQKTLPPDVAVLYYAALDDRLFIWVLTRGGKEFIETPVHQAEVAYLVERWRSDVAAEARQTDILMALYDMLIRPIARNLPDRALLVIVPDGVLHAVPFAALMRRENRRYLVEDHVLDMAPSLTILDRSAKRLQTATPRFTSALVVGNPRSDAGGLVSLPEAEREAREIVALYPDREMLIGADATKTRFLASAGHHDLVHFAGHGISNDEYPSLSRLLFAGAGESDRSLFASDIAAMRLERTRLVILAACRTSAGRIRRGEGALSLARPFIAAGVPMVVASLWDIDDRASHSLFVTFHRALRRGAAVAEALRSAQLAALADSDPVLRDPGNWATFTVIGGLPAFGFPDAVAPSFQQPTGPIQ
jgi:CHAT domain-containing protein